MTARQPAAAGSNQHPTILLVGGDDLLADMVSSLRPDALVRWVPDAMAALGELSSIDRAQIVLVPVDGLGGESESVARAMRLLSHDARLVAVTDERSAGSAGAVSAFDASVIKPISLQSLAPAIAAPSPASRSSLASPSSPSLDTDLGDVDLLEDLMANCGSLSDKALRIIAARSGIPAAGFVAGTSQEDTRRHVPIGRSAAVVSHRGQTFGLLHAPLPATEEKLAPWAGWMGSWLAMSAHVSSLWELALRDEMTGAWNRRYFNRFLDMIVKRAVNERFRVTLMLFDIDDFKLYNDRFGHPAGDEILRETSRLMQSVVRDHDVVARIGGDEFAVIFWDAQGPRRPNSQHPDDVRKAAERFQKAITSHRFPKLAHQAMGTLTISGGLASFPWDGRTPEELIDKADAMCLQSKNQGKNALTFGPGARGSSSDGG